MALALDQVIDQPRNRCIPCLKCIYHIKEAYVIMLATIIGVANLCLSLFCLLFLFPANIFNTVRGFDSDLLVNIILVWNMLANLFFGIHMLVLT